MCHCSNRSTCVGGLFYLGTPMGRWRWLVWCGLVLGPKQYYRLESMGFPVGQAAQPLGLSRLHPFVN